MNIKMRGQMPKPMAFFFARIFPWVFILVGAGIIYLGVKEVILASSSDEWPSVQGVVRNSSVDYRDSDEGSGTYHAEVMYEYEIDGNIYSSNQVSFGEYGSSDPSHARDVVNRYPVGMEVLVFYMPASPDESVLESGMSMQVWYLPIFGFVFFGAGSLFAYGLPRAFRKDMPNSQAFDSEDTFVTKT